MDIGAQRRTVGGIFTDEESATLAVKRLIAEHFDPDADLTVIASNGNERERVPVGATYDVLRTAAIGALVGAVVVALGGLIAGLDFGFFTMERAGPVWAALEMAYVGGCFGFAIGALLSTDFARAGANFRNVRVRGGAIWVGVLAAGPRAELARRIMTEAGGGHFVGNEPKMGVAA